MPRVCPRCKSERIHRSHRRGVLERLLSVLGLKARRCHECNTRFVAIGKSTLYRSDVEFVLRKISLVVLSAAAVLAAVMAVLCFSRTQETPSTPAAVHHTIEKVAAALHHSPPCVPRPSRCPPRILTHAHFPPPPQSRYSNH